MVRDVTNNGAMICLVINQDWRLNGGLGFVQQQGVISGYVYGGLKQKNRRFTSFNPSSRLRSQPSEHLHPFFLMDGRSKDDGRLVFLPSDVLYVYPVGCTRY